MPAVDADGDPLTYEYEFSVNGVSAQGPSTKSHIGKNTVQRGEAWVVSVTASDGSTSGPTATASVNIGNAPATLTDCDVTPTSPGTLDTLTVNGGGFSDLEGDPEDYAYAWYIDYNDGNGWTLVRETKKLPYSLTSVDYSIKATCTANDGFDLGSTVESAVITINNTPPEATDCVLASLGSDPNAPLTNDDLQASGIGFDDPNGDPEQFRYEWYRNGVRDTTVTDDTDPLYPASRISKGQQIHVECIPYDDIAGDGSPVQSNTLTVGNTAPDAPVVSIDPSQPNTTSTLQAQIDFQEPDPDGDAITYVYTWNLATTTSAAISPSATTQGELWTVSVTACDTDPTAPKCSATSGTASVTIGNSLPSLSKAATSINSSRWQ